MRTPLRVLIVEDSEDDADLLLRELRRGGYAPAFERVDTPGAMRAALDRNSWDIVLSDFSLPQFSGLAALALLQERGPDLPFIRQRDGGPQPARDRDDGGPGARHGDERG